jgi:triacylglycerol esterase/lipase EstA (alpha/beta hydrolase family)
MRLVRLGVELFGLLVVVFTAATYAARAWVQHRADTAKNEPIGLIDASRAFVAECVSLAVVLLSIPLGWVLPRCTAAAAQGPIILVHGWGLNRGCWWLLRRRLRRDGWGPVCAVDYRSINADIEAAARQLRDVVESIDREHPAKPLTLIGHSLGGLVIRCFARRYPAPRVRRIVTIGTPHFGTELARLPSPTHRRLAPGSALLAALNAGDRLPQQFDVIAIHSSFDAMVLPASSAHYPLAFNIQLNDVGHNALLFSAKVYRLLAENLLAPPPGLSA